MRQGLQCSEWGKPVPGLEPTKLSEPMWTLFFELHAGPWRTTGHDKRPDTRPIEAPRRNVAEKITLPNRGHPHTPRRDPCHKPESCASPNRSPKREFQPYPDPPSRRLLGAAPASYDAGRRGHPPHQFSGLLEQDAREVCTKRRKTFTTWFFPVGEDFRRVVAE